MVARSTGREQTSAEHTPPAYALAVIAYTTPWDAIRGRGVGAAGTAGRTGSWPRLMTRHRLLQELGPREQRHTYQQQNHGRPARQITPLSAPHQIVTPAPRAAGDCAQT
jgi:hypothetical protein